MLWSPPVADISMQPQIRSRSPSPSKSAAQGAAAQPTSSGLPSAKIASRKASLGVPSGLRPVASYQIDATGDEPAGEQIESTVAVPVDRIENGVVVHREDASTLRHRRRRQLDRFSAGRHESAGACTWESASHVREKFQDLLLPHCDKTGCGFARLRRQGRFCRRHPSRWPTAPPTSRHQAAGRRSCKRDGRSESSAWWACRRLDTPRCCPAPPPTRRSIRPSPLKSVSVTRLWIMSVERVPDWSAAMAAVTDEAPRGPSQLAPVRRCPIDRSHCRRVCDEAEADLVVRVFRPVLSMHPDEPTAAASSGKVVKVSPAGMDFPPQMQSVGGMDVLFDFREFVGDCVVVPTQRQRFVAEPVQLRHQCERPQATRDRFASPAKSRPPKF